MEFTKEEKKAIRIEKESTKLETLIELLYTDRLSQYGKRELVNYIEKQQKEIEEYKEHYENMKWYYDNQKDNLIHKDKIRELLKSKDIELTGVISYRELEKLLEEK